jgi:sulfonate transport system permease protein
MKNRTFYIFIFPLALVSVWELSIVLGFIPNTIMATPVQVLFDFFELLLNGKLLFHSAISIFRLIFGFLIGTAAGLFLGTLVGISKRSESIFAPTLQVLAPIPAIAWGPLVIILFGIGEVSKISLIAIATFFIVYINTFTGIRSTDQKLVEVARCYNKPDRELITKVLIPSAIPQIFTGLRVALGLSWILLIAAELIASSNGLGWLIWDARNFSRPDDLLVGMITIGFWGKMSDMLLVFLEKRWTKWKKSFEGN